MVDYEALGKRIRYRRRMMKLSQKQVADAINISVSFYGNIERGLRIPSIDTLVDVANHLETSTDFLLAESLAVAGKQHTRHSSYGCTFRQTHCYISICGPGPEAYRSF